MRLARYRRWLYSSSALALLLFSPIFSLFIEAFQIDTELLAQLRNNFV